MFNRERRLEEGHGKLEMEDLSREFLAGSKNFFEKLETMGSKAVKVDLDISDVLVEPTRVMDDVQRFISSSTAKQTRVVVIHASQEEYQQFKDKFPSQVAWEITEQKD